MPPKWQDEAYEELPIYQSIKINPPKMTNSTSADVTFGGARCNRVVANQEKSHSTALADTQCYSQPLLSGLIE